MRVLHWLYTGVLDLSDAGDSAGAAGEAEGGEPGGESEESARAVSLLVAADALGAESLREACEAHLARISDVHNAIELLGLSTQLHCPRLRAFSLATLSSELGASVRSNHASGLVGEIEERCSDRAATLSSSRPWFEGGKLEVRLEAETRRGVDAYYIARLIDEFEGFDELSEEDREAVEWTLGLPKAALVGQEGVVCTTIVY